MTINERIRYFRKEVLHLDQFISERGGSALELEFFQAYFEHPLPQERDALLKKFVRLCLSSFPSDVSF